MLNVRLVTSPHVRHPAVLATDFVPAQDLMYTFAPIGLLSLIASVVRELGVEPELFDLNGAIISGSVVLDDGFYRSAAKRLTEGRPDVVGFMTECDSYHHVLQIAEESAQLSPSSRIVLGGPHASAVAVPTLERCSFIDAVVRGEGEVSFPRLLESYARNEAQAVRGVVRRGPDGNVLDGGAPDLVSDLDDLPIPAFKRYAASPSEEVFIEVGRGCPFNCTFCSTAPFWRRKHRVKSPKRILAEIQIVQELYGSERVHFTHDLFTTDRKWVLSVCNALKEAGNPVRWTCSARTDLVNRDLLECMASAGCSAIYFGLESGSDRVLREIGKAIPLGRSLEVLSECRSVGITPNAGFIVGLPSDDITSVRATFEVYEKVLRLGCRPTHIFGFCPFADSAIYRSLPTLRSTGHFLDLPLSERLDWDNRRRVASDPELHGSYFRPQNSALETRCPGFIEGVDEFSVLVDAALLPSLLLSDCLGGMQAVYEAWLSWIESHNSARGAAPWRLWYGGPVEYCSFLAESLATSPGTQVGAHALARVLGESHRIAAQLRAVPFTSMAQHRSFDLDRAGVVLTLGSSLRCGNVLDTFTVEYDVAAGLAWQPGDPPPKFPAECMRLAWQRTTDGGVRLLTVPDIVFRLIGDLKGSSVSVAELLSGWLRDQTDLSWNGDFDVALRIITRAVEQGLVARSS